MNFKRIYEAGNKKQVTPQQQLDNINNVIQSVTGEINYVKGILTWLNLLAQSKALNDPKAAETLKKVQLIINNCNEFNKACGNEKEGFLGKLNQQKAQLEKNGQGQIEDKSKDKKSNDQNTNQNNNQNQNTPNAGKADDVEYELKDEK